MVELDLDYPVYAHIAYSSRNTNICSIGWQVAMESFLDVNVMVFIYEYIQAGRSYSSLNPERADSRKPSRQIDGAECLQSRNKGNVTLLWRRWCKVRR